MPTDFERQLRDALTAPMSETQLDALDARVRTDLDAPRARARRRPPARLLLLAAAIALLLPVGALAGMFSSESPQGLGGVDEFQAELDAAMADVPIPPGQSWPDSSVLDAGQDIAPVESGQPSSRPLFSRGGGRATVEYVAICLWLDEWLAAKQLNDLARTQAASMVLFELPSWPSWNGPFWDESLTDLLEVVLHAIAAEDEEPVRQFVGLNCAD